MPYCYLIYSPSQDKFYIGSTQNSVAERIEKHNSAYYGKNKFTVIASDWELFLSIKALSITHAIRIERYIKRMKSSVYLKNLNKYPELIVHLVEKTKYNNLAQCKLESLSKNSVTHVSLTL